MLLTTKVGFIWLVGTKVFGTCVPRSLSSTFMCRQGVGKSKTMTVTTKSLIHDDDRTGSRTDTDIVVESQKKFTFPFIYPFLLLIKQDIPSSQGYLSATACWAPFAIHCLQDARCVCVCVSQNMLSQCEGAWVSWRKAESKQGNSWLPGKKERQAWIRKWQREVDTHTQTFAQNP